ncbi:hypothetical protein ES703_15804 [subsurface metagenome]
MAFKKNLAAIYPHCGFDAKLPFDPEKLKLLHIEYWQLADDPIPPMWLLLSEPWTWNFVDLPAMDQLVSEPWSS